MPTKMILSVAAVLLLVPATAQLSGDISVTTDDVTTVDAEVDDAIDGVANATVDAAVETQDASVKGTVRSSNASAGIETMYGQLQLSQGKGHGQYVALGIGSEGIEDYRVGNDSFFAAIDVGALSATATGARLEAAFAGGHLQATDTASAGLRLDATESTHAEVHLGPGATAVQASDRLVWIEAGHRSGSLAILGNGSMALDGASLAIHLAPGSILRFEAQTGDDRAWQEEQRAFASGRLGAELGIAGDAARTTLADEYSVQVSNVRSGDRSVAFSVDSDIPHPRVVTVAMAASLLSSDAEMRFDGQPAERAAAPEVYAAADSSVALYSLVEVDGALQAVVHVPGFSSHDIEFGPASSGSEAAGEDAPGIGFLAVGGIVAVVALARRL